MLPQLPRQRGTSVIRSPPQALRERGGVDAVDPGLVGVLSPSSEATILGGAAREWEAVACTDYVRAGHGLVLRVNPQP